MDVVTGGIATITDGAALITNSVNAGLAYRKSQFRTAAWDSGSAILGALGLGAALRVFGAAAAAEEVENAASDVADSLMKQSLRDASTATTLQDRMAAIEAARVGAASFDATGMVFDEEAENVAMISEQAESRAWLLTMIGLSFGMEETASNECG